MSLLKSRSEQAAEIKALGEQLETATASLQALQAEHAELKEAHQEAEINTAYLEGQLNDSKSALAASQARIAELEEQEATFDTRVEEAVAAKVASDLQALGHDPVEDDPADGNQSRAELTEAEVLAEFNRLNKTDPAAATEYWRANAEKAGIHSTHRRRAFVR